jgi:hypothetical protein
MDRVQTNLNKISNQIRNEIDNYQFVILDENDNNIDYRYHTYYSLVNILSLAYFFCTDPYCESFKFVNFMKKNTVFDIEKVNDLYIKTKEDKENIIFLINDTINCYKYFNQKLYISNTINNENFLSINPFYFGNDQTYMVELNNDKIIDILMNAINVIESIIVSLV